MCDEYNPCCHKYKLPCRTKTAFPATSTLWSCLTLIWSSPPRDEHCRAEEKILITFAQRKYKLDSTVLHRTTITLYSMLLCSALNITHVMTFLRHNVYFRLLITAFFVTEILYYKVYISIYYTTSSASGQDEPNLAL